VVRSIGNVQSQANSEFRAVASGALWLMEAPLLLMLMGRLVLLGETVISEAVGTPTAFGSGVGFYNAVSFDSNSNRMVIAYRDNGNSDYGTAVVATVNSNNTLTLGTPVVFISSQYPKP
jgi:hypothetical protein